MHSVVAATSDTIRVWELGAPGMRGLTPRASSSTAGQRCVIAKATYAADAATDAIEGITSVSWAASGKTFVAAGKGTAIRQYGWTGEVLQDIRPEREAERAGLMHVAAVRHYGETSNALFIANNVARQVRRWDFVRRDYTAVCQTHNSAISCMDVCAKKRLVASATASGGEIALFNLLHNTRNDLRSATHKALTCIGIAPGHRSLVAVGSEDGLVQVFDAARSGAVPQQTLARVHSAPLRGIAFHPLSHSTLITAGLDRRVVVTDTNGYSGATRAKGALEILSKAPLTCLSRSQDPCVIGVGTIDGDVLVYDARMPVAPLWHARVRSGHAVVSMDLVQGSTAESASSSRSLRQSSSLQEARPAGRGSAPNAGHGSSDETATIGEQQEHRRTAGATVAIATARLASEH